MVAAQAVSDGRRIRWTLEQRATQDQQRVRCDWLRFTLPVAAVCPWVERLPVDATVLGAMDWQERELQLAARLSEGDDEPAGALYVARKAAQAIADVLGVFELGQVDDKGLDYYLCRVPLLVEGQVVGHVLAGGKTQSQAATVHVNLHGEGCLRVSHAKWAEVASFIEAGQGWITRCDLAVDVFAGEDIAAVPGAYLAGAFNVRGQRPAQREAGAWTSGHSRTFYVGRRETGKEFRGYEKGDQLFGADVGDPWVRYEVEFRNNARVIATDILRRPADFFAGAYPFCADLLARLSIDAAAERIPAGQRVKDATAKAAAMRLGTWVKSVAAPSLCALLRYGGEVLDLIVDSEAHRVPGRLRGWSASEVHRAFSQAFGALAPAPSLSTSGAA